MRNRYDRRASRGARWLDSHTDPHWPSRIDVDRLDLYSATNCVFGQVFARNPRGVTGFEAGLNKVGPSLIPARGGFICFPTGRAHRRQTEAWKRLLRNKHVKNVIRRKTAAEAYKRLREGAGVWDDDFMPVIKKKELINR